jgi:preprotein translocase subunit YajC
MGGGWVQLVPFFVMIAIFYFLLIRPQQRKQRELQDWLKSLKKGDDVVTTGGLVGRISGLTDQIVTLELQEKVRVRVLRSHIAGKAPGANGPGPSAPQAPQSSDAKTG